MKNIYEIAINGFKDEQGYLSNCPNQIPITTYLWVITSIFGKNILIPKIFNIICNVGIIYFLYKIYLVIADTNELSSDKKAIMWFSTPILSVVLYENHIYNDILFTFLTTILIYLVLKKQDTNLIFAIVCVLSVVQYVIRPTGIIYIIAIFLYMVLYQQHYRKALVYVLFCVSLIFGVGKLNKKIFNVDTTKEYPIWSYIQMGVNEQEFGFQDGSHSMDWTKEDCVEKYKALGMRKLLRIYVKKEIWMWSEGTYQAERYGLGDYYATFTKDNKITETVRNVDNSMIRKVLEQMMKAQYYIYMFFALVGLLTVWKRNRKDMRLQVLLLYVICGFFCFYLVWEIKSRYIYSLYPIFMIYGFIGFSIFVDGIEKIFGGNR
ncbi:MAG: glycosyltransferase family 39 protein [Lachnospiraceae bacterium]|nr:glycosyltransferase family 39 protein [Lachnospiraceae bacterium]